MEALSSKSRIKPCAGTYAVAVSDTALSFQRHYERFLNPSTPVSHGQSSFTFVIPPSVSSELHIPSSELHISVKLVKEDGTSPPITAQVGIVNAFSALMWQDCFVRINGSPFLPELTHCSHYQVNIIFAALYCLVIFVLQ